jgi:hypothetical protein
MTDLRIKSQGLKYFLLFYLLVLLAIIKIINFEYLFLLIVECGPIVYTFLKDNRRFIRNLTYSFSRYYNLIEKKLLMEIEGL